jgi:hypothetical protein
VFALILLFVLGVLAKRDEITSSVPESALAPLHSLEE